MINTRLRLLTLLIPLWLPSVGNAQIVVGAKTGLNINQFQQPGTTFGATLGAFASYRPLPFVTVKLEPQYSSEGGGRPDYARDYSDISSNVLSVTMMNPSIRFHNLQFPVLAEVSLPEHADEVIKPKLIVGIVYSMMMSATEVSTKRYQFAENPDLGSNYSYFDVAYQHDNVIDNYRRNQWSMLLGMGVDFKSGSRTFSFDVRYRKGLTDLNLLRYASPSEPLSAGGSTGVPGTGGKLYSSSISLNFSMSLFNF